MAGPINRKRSSARITPIKRSSSSSSLFEVEQGFEVQTHTNNKKVNKHEEIIVLSSSSDSSPEEIFVQNSSLSGDSSISYCNSSISSTNGALETLTQPPPPPPPIPTIPPVILSPSLGNAQQLNEPLMLSTTCKIPKKDRRRNKNLESGGGDVITSNNHKKEQKRQSFQRYEEAQIAPATTMHAKKEKRPKKSHPDKIDKAQAAPPPSNVIQNKECDSFDKNLADTTKHILNKSSSTLKAPTNATVLDIPIDAGNASSNNSCASSSSSRSVTVSVKLGGKRSVLETMVPVIVNSTTKKKKNKSSKEIKEKQVAKESSNASLQENVPNVEVPIQSVVSNSIAISTPEVTPQCTTAIKYTPTTNIATTATVTSKTSSKNQQAASNNKEISATKTKPTTPRKKKKTFQDQIFHTMLISCKPYTLKTLAQSTKSTTEVLNSMMLSLVDKDLVKKKECTVGKTGKANKTLYWANQEASSKEVKIDIASPEDRRVAWDEYNTLIRKEKSILQELATIEKEPSNDELDLMIRKMEEEVAEVNITIQQTNVRIETGFQQPKKGRYTQNKPMEKCPRKVKININHFRNEWKLRKEKCMDFLDNLCDAMEKKLKDVCKLLDVERDEDLEVTIPPKYSIDPL